MDPANEFRWQALLGRSSDALFVLNRRRRIQYVNPAWEALSGKSSAEVRGLVCRKSRPANAGEPFEAVLAHALTPGVEVMQGKPGRTRRFIPGSPPCWWDVEFFPLRDQEGVLAILGRATLVPMPAGVSVPLPEKLIALRQQTLGGFTFDLLQSDCFAMRRVTEQARLASQVNVCALLIGEAGVGKTTLARVIHAQGPRREQPLAVIDCARLPVLAQAELLFDARAGLIRQGVGTIYLRGVDHLARELQLRLVEKLREPGAYPRILAGTRARPGQSPAEGLIQEFACLLQTMSIEVPPLRERLSDMPLLVERQLISLQQESTSRITTLNVEAWRLLRGHPWPGNLRELRTVLASALAHASGEEITEADLPESLRLPQRVAESSAHNEPQPIPLEQLLQEAERRMIQLALHRAAGNKTRAAELLGIWRQRLLRRMQALGIEDSEERGP